MDRPNDLTAASIKEGLLAVMDPIAGFHALFDYIDSVFFFAKDLEGRILFANPQLVRHYGFSKSEDMIGKTDFDFLPRSLAEEYRLDDIQVARSKEPLIRQVELFLDDKGVPGWYMTTKFPIIAKKGKAIGVMGVIQEFDASHPRFFEGRKLSELINYIKDHPQESIQPGELTRVSGLSARTIQRLFQKTLNTTPRDLLMKMRIRKACDLLRFTEDTISDIAIDCGFYDQSAFTRNFKKRMGMTPKHYRAGA
jgi:PAS domain S-box-containing protein